MTIILANAIIRNNISSATRFESPSPAHLCADNDRHQRFSSFQHSPQRPQVPDESFFFAASQVDEGLTVEVPPQVNPPRNDDSNESATVNIASPSVSHPRRGTKAPVMLSEVLKMNDKELLVQEHNNIPCDSGEINNNNNNLYDPAMGVKYHSDRLGVRDDTMSPSRVPKDRGDDADNDTMESDNGRRSRTAAAIDRIDNGVAVDNDNDREAMAAAATSCSADHVDDDEDEEDADDADNDSVLSVGRDDENNFEDVPLSRQPALNHPQQPKLSSSSISSMEVDDLQGASDSRGGVPRGLLGPFSPLSPLNGPSLDTFNLGLSFRNIQNHLTSLKNYSPLDVFATPPNAGVASPGSFFKSSAFRSTTTAAANSNSFYGLNGLSHPTAELLQRYDMLRGSLNRPGMNFTQRDEDNLKFSIDNILKADFGRRRITDPINKLRKISNTIIQNAAMPNHHKLPSSSMSPTSSTNSSASSPVLQSPPPPASAFGDSPTKLFSPIDLTAAKGDSSSGRLTARNGEGIGEARATPPKGTATGAGGKGGKESSGSGAPMVWPAWVYCTRYSDRPSSGEWRI